MAQERLRRDGLVHQGRKLRGVQKQQTLLAEEGRRVGAGDAGEMGFIGLQLRGQVGRRLLGLFRFGGIDRDHQKIVELRKLPVELFGGLAPAQPVGKQARSVGRDPEMPGREQQRQSGADRAGQYDKKEPLATRVSHPDKQALERHGGR